MRQSIVLLCLFLSACTGLKPKSSPLGINLVKGPTAKEAKLWRKSQKWRKVKKGWSNKKLEIENIENDYPVLINGNPVDKGKYPAVVRIISDSGAGCTASIVGPKAIITAAHCATTGERVSFTGIDGVNYQAVMTRYENWPSTDLDLNLGVMSTETKLTPLSIRTDVFETSGMLVDMIGYGCINPGGGGGNDGVLRIGQGKTSGAQGFDLILDAAPSALCYGDSGGPVMYQGKLIGINSKGNIQDKSYTTRTTLPEAKAWLTSEANALGLLICGINTTCGGDNPQPPIPVPPPSSPKQFFFEDANVKIQGIIK